MIISQINNGVYNYVTNVAGKGKSFKYTDGYSLTKIPVEVCLDPTVAGEVRMAEKPTIAAMLEAGDITFSEYKVMINDLDICLCAGEIYRSFVNATVQTFAHVENHGEFIEKYGFDYDDQMELNALLELVDLTTGGNIPNDWKMCCGSVLVGMDLIWREPLKLLELPEFADMMLEFQQRGELNVAV